jgi:hypothetical protein
MLRRKIFVKKSRRKGLEDNFSKLELRVRQEAGGRDRGEPVSQGLKAKNHNDIQLCWGEINK